MADFRKMYLDIFSVCLTKKVYYKKEIAVQEISDATSDNFVDYLGEETGTMNFFSAASCTRKQQLNRVVCPNFGHPALTSSFTKI